MFEDMRKDLTSEEPLQDVLENIDSLESLGEGAHGKQAEDLDGDSETCEEQESQESQESGETQESQESGVEGEIAFRLRKACKQRRVEELIPLFSNLAKSNLAPGPTQFCVTIPWLVLWPRKYTRCGGGAARCWRCSSALSGRDKTKKFCTSST